MTTEEKLEYFRNTTITAAHEESRKALEDYSSALEKIFKEHQEAEQQKAELQIRHEKERIQRDGNAQMAREQMHIKHRLSLKHSELKEKLFAEVAEKLTEYKKSDAYTQLLVRQIKKEKSFAKDEQIIIYIDPDDKDKLSYLQEETNTMLTISAFSFGGGTRAVIPKKNILIDYSFDTKYQETKENFKFDGGTPNGN
ncbi:MAG: V-type ATP synthase subunit E [Lachnospiraceae bacterium]